MICSVCIIISLNIFSGCFYWCSFFFLFSLYYYIDSCRYNYNRLELIQLLARSTENITAIYSRLRIENSFCRYWQDAKFFPFCVWLPIGAGSIISLRQRFLIWRRVMPVSAQEIIDELGYKAPKRLAPGIWTGGWMGGLRRLIKIY